MSAQAQGRWCGGRAGAFGLGLADEPVCGDARVAKGHCVEFVLDRIKRLLLRHSQIAASQKFSGADQYQRCAVGLAQLRLGGNRLRQAAYGLRDEEYLRLKILTGMLPAF